eukprot:GDKH01001905.1.p1 GENE.GDKH01001905.1~~GDKH01001905.1.p1  ORF type:complete len:284 (+),score=58.97 GDKH01001905.1:136-987(+)
MASFGEDFMSMFDDYETWKAKSKPERSSESALAGDSSTAAPAPKRRKKEKSEKNGSSTAPPPTAAATKSPVPNAAPKAAEQAIPAAKVKPALQAFPSKAKSVAPMPTAPRPDKREMKAFFAASSSAVMNGLPDNSPPSPRRKKRKAADQAGSEQEAVFSETIRDLRNLVLPHLDKVQRKQITDAKLRAMGGRPDQERRMPYAQLMEFRKREAEKEKKNVDEKEKQLGVQLRTHKGNFNQKLRKKKEEVNKARSRRDVAQTFRVGHGSERGGIVKLQRTPSKKR